jgi:hypothetical protein
MTEYFAVRFFDGRYDSGMGRSVERLDDACWFKTRDDALESISAQDLWLVASPARFRVDGDEYTLESP